MPSGVVFFDIDGTLVPTTSTGRFLAERLGHLGRMTQAEASYASGTITNRDVCVTDAAGFQGTSVSQVTEWLTALPTITGIEPVLAWCDDHDVVAMLATVAWRTVSEGLADRFGFHVSGGPELEVVDGVYTGGVSRHFDEFDKRDAALRAAGSLGVDPARSVAIGDSRSDVPLFRAAALSIALNATPEIEALTSVSTRTDDLRDVIAHLEAFFISSR